MKTLVVLLLVPYMVLANCQWSTVKKVDGGYLYNKECHIKVGELIIRYDLKSKQLAKTEELLAVTNHEAEIWKNEAAIWRNSSHKLAEELNKQRTANHIYTWVYFGLGIVTTSAVFWIANQGDK